MKNTPAAWLPRPVACAALACIAAAPAQAVRTTTEGGTEIDFSSTVSYGLQVRLRDPSRFAIGNDNGGTVPTSARLGSQINGPGNDATANPDFNFLNSDDGNLNFHKGDLTSAALKGTHEFGLKTTDGWRARCCAAAGCWTRRPATPAARR